MLPIKTSVAIACLLPLSSCSVLGKAGIKVNGENVAAPTPAASAPSPPPSGAPASANQPAPVASTTSAFTQPTAAVPAAQVGDSVPAIPAAISVAAIAGAPVISLTGVSWCSDQVKGLDWGDKVEYKYKRALKGVSNLHYTGMESIREIARFACGGSKSADRLSWVQSYMQARANETGMSQAHQSYLFGYLANKDTDPRNFSNYNPASCEKFKAKGNPNRLESELNQAKLVGIGCKDYGNTDWMAWWMDRGSALDSKLTTLGWLYSTFAASAKVVSLQRGLLAYHDAKAFDIDGYFSELHTLGADAAITSKAIVKYYGFKSKFDAWEVQHREVLSEDFDSIIASAEAGFSSWQQSYKANKAAVDFAFKMEEHVLEGNKQNFEGCSELSRKYATDFVMQNNPKTVEEIQREAAHPIGSLIVAAAYECEKALGNTMSASIYAQMLKEAPTVRGPRYAARLASVTAVAELKAVKTRLPLRARDFVPPSQKGGFGNASVGYFDTGRGVVAKVKKSGDKLVVQFKKESWKEAVYKCRETRRIDRIDSRGNLVYRKICKQTGTKTISSTEKPITVAASAAMGIRPGAFLVVARSKEDNTQGLPRKVYKSKKKETLLNYYGLALK